MNLLSIKGGGTRGIIVTRFLVEIENITKKPIYELFDYIGGSSVGTLIACGVLITQDNIKPKYTAQQLHDLFIANILNCFSWTYYSYMKSFFGLIGPTYTPCGLNNIINICCENNKLGNLLRHIIFPTYDRIRHKTYYFDTEKDADVPLSDVILGCCAAPTYFPSHKIKIKDEIYDFVDSGIVVNNNCELVFLHATKNTNVLDKSKILLLNIGTGTFTSTVTERNGLLTWIPNIIDILMNATNENELYELSLSLHRDNYFIMDVPLDIKYYYTDDIRQTTINHYINETEKWIFNNREAIYLFCDKLMINKGLFLS